MAWKQGARYPGLALRFAILALLAAGCGGSSAREPQEPAASDFGVVPVEIYGEASLLRRGTHKTVVLRHDGTAVEAFDSGEEAVGPSAFGARIVFSSDGVAWGAGYSDAESAWLLLRSDDGARTWNRFDALPFPEVSSVLDLHVDEATAGVLTAWVAATVGEFMPNGPHVWTRPLDREAEWRELADIVPLGCTRRAIFARRAGALELLRANGPCAFPPDAETAIYRLSDRGVEMVERIDLPFAVADYATAGDRGWIAGAREVRGGSRISQVPAILTAKSGEPWEMRDLPGFVEGSLEAIDFADESNGFACGQKESLAPFCVFTEDGGESWSRSELALPAGAGGITDVVQIGNARGLAVFRAGVVRDGLLETLDGGRHWMPAPLPPLASKLQIGALARGTIVAAPETRAQVSDAARHSERNATTPVLRSSSPLQASGTRAWAVGDSASRGPTIMGIALRSDDGGLSWQEVLSAPGGSFAGVAFVDALTGWVVGAGKVFRTDDGGESFVDQTSGIASADHILSIHRVVAMDTMRAVLVARVSSPAFPGEEEDALLYTVDGGVTWQRSAIGIKPVFPNESFVEGGLCLTRSGVGVMVRYTNVLLTRDAGATWIAGPAFEYAFGGDGWSVSGEGFGQPTVACSDEANLWIVVGTNDPRTLDPETQTLWHSPDGGESWEDLSPKVGRRYDSFTVVGAFASSASGWLVGAEEPERASLIRTLDRGLTWVALASPLAPNSGPGYPTLEFPEAIAFATDSNGLMLTTIFDSFDDTRHSTLSTSDGGETWTRSALPPDVHPLGLSFTP